MNKVTIVLGTAREGNFSQKIAKIVFEHVAQKKFEVDYLDIKDFLFSKTIAPDEGDVSVKSWVNIISNTDAIIFVCPEYNHSYPGELKILIDSLGEEYKGKIAGIVSVSAGRFAGVRVTEALKILLHTLNFEIVHANVNVANVKNEIDEERVKRHVDGLVEEINSRLSS